MTRSRYDNHSTEFGLWIRQQEEIASELGYITTNVDFMWRNYKTKQWMLIEEKRYNKRPGNWQKTMFDVLDAASKSDNNYCGFHYLRFENTSPEDGAIWLDDKPITKSKLIQFLKFDFPESS